MAEEDVMIRVLITMGIFVAGMAAGFILAVWANHNE